MTAPHQILGIRPNATQDEIRSAWRALVRRAHPDLVGSSVSTTARMTAINAAHDAMLDALGRAARRSGPGGPVARRRPSRTRPRPVGHAASPRQERAAEDPDASVSGRSRAGPRPERPFAAPRRLVPDRASVMRMKAALIGRLRQLLQHESARLGGPAYSVPGQPGWRDDAAVRASGGLPSTHHVTRIDVAGATVRLTLDSRPVAGPLLLALPRLVREGAAAIRQEPAVTVLELAMPRGEAPVTLTQAEALRCIAGGEGLTVDLRFP